MFLVQMDLSSVQSTFTATQVSHSKNGDHGLEKASEGIARKHVEIMQQTVLKPGSTPCSNKN